MASVHKRSWKLQDFVAHNANVNCLSLGRKSGRVMVTGGDDKKVNLWAVGKQNCFMSLSGHTTPVECVRFNCVEELVCAGSRAGAIKIWDLEAAKLIRTLNGHRDSISCVDFHPYGDHLASGSVDRTIKMWDSRRKGHIFSYPGHGGRVNDLKFSPDGQWIASGGDDSAVKIWDLRVGRVLKEFSSHVGPVTCVEFHPHEFLLATGGADGVVNFSDLEEFSMVSRETDLGAVRCVCFNPDGKCLFAGVRDYLKVIGWEPGVLHDNENVAWGRIFDVSLAHNQLVGASFQQTNVTVHVVDLAKVKPLGRTDELSPPSPFAKNQGIRRSFSKAESPIGLRNKAAIDVKATIEENTSGTDPEEDASSTADITNVKDYNEIFRGKGLLRTPPPEPEPFTPQQIIEPATPDPTEPQLLLSHESWENAINSLPPDNRINYSPPSPRPPTRTVKSYSRSKSNLDQVFANKPRDHPPAAVDAPRTRTTTIPAPKHGLFQRQGSREEKTRTVQDERTRLTHDEKTRSTQEEKTRITLDERTRLIQDERLRLTQDEQPQRDRNGRTNGIKHSVSDVNLSKMSTATTGVPKSNNNVRKNSLSGAGRTQSVSNVSNSYKIPVSSARNERNTRRTLQAQPVPVDIYVSPKISPDEPPEDDYVPTCIDKPVGLDLEDFLPKNHATHQSYPNLSDNELPDVILRKHAGVMSVLATRQRNLKFVCSEYRSKDIKAAFELAVALTDLALIFDLLNIINQKYTLWNLDLCVILLPKIEELLRSRYEAYITRGCDSLKLILRHFGTTIKANIQYPAGSFGVDIPREERYRKSVKCHDFILSIRSVLGNKSFGGALGSAVQEVHAQLKTIFD